MLSAIMEKTILPLLLLSLLLFPALSLCDITSCSQTPYPEACNSFLPTVSQDTVSGFRNVAIMAAMDQAQATLSWCPRGSMSSRAQAAWADCLELTEDTVSKLNKTLVSSNLASSDTLTWLSAAITNDDTCRTGFSETPWLKSTDLSKLLSNSLAVEKSFAARLDGLSGHTNRKLLSVQSRGFPEWVVAGDRRLLQASTGKANLVVAKDGSGGFATISAAITASEKQRKTSTSRFVIYVKEGTYKENIEIKKSMKNLMFVGDGIDKTIITGSRNVQDGSTTFRSATFAVAADGFIAKDLTFENTAGPQKHQAVAFRSGSDLSVLYRCSFKGYQDTLYTYSQRQFYRECDIYGTVDFIFGNAAAVLQNCNIYVRKPMSSQKNTITAQGRTDPNQNTGLSIHDSKVSASSDLKAVQNSFKTYLGRPWKEYSRTVFMKTALDNLIDPSGWLQWSGNFALRTLYYGEYMNSGAGAVTKSRVKWSGFHVMSASEAAKFTVGSFISGGSWIPNTGLPYTSGL
ncbi:hypothetical protein AMTR_s00010p00161740 [Amborella trichopoda]|uniref:Pectinesterase n=2 Tax=Amborella trichopoda TaxID=13333 RepID=W1NFB3_AMBTC|nr:hypothetical protein AMTR_s00010p00161740 [Amborella trichopoda]